MNFIGGCQQQEKREFVFVVYFKRILGITLWIQWGKKRKSGQLLPPGGVMPRVLFLSPPHPHEDARLSTVLW